MEKGGVITLVPEVPLNSFKGALEGISKTDLRGEEGPMVKMTLSLRSEPSGAEHGLWRSEWCLLAGC